MPQSAGIGSRARPHAKARRPPGQGRESFSGGFANNLTKLGACRHGGGSRRPRGGQPPPIRPFGAFWPRAPGLQLRAPASQKTARLWGAGRAGFSRALPGARTRLKNGQGRRLGPWPSWASPELAGFARSTPLAKPAAPRKHGGPARGARGGFLKACFRRVFFPRGFTHFPQRPARFTRGAGGVWSPAAFRGEAGLEPFWPPECSPASTAKLRIL